MNLELKIIPIIQLVICVFLTLAARYIFPQFNYSLAYNNVFCIVLFTLAIVIALKAILDFRKNQTTVNPTTPQKSTTVVATGIYAFSRNPMYLAMLIALLTFSCWLENIIGFMTSPLFFFYITKYQIIPEERALTQLFGESYNQYKSRVRRWL